MIPTYAQMQRCVIVRMRKWINYWDGKKDWLFSLLVYYMVLGQEITRLKLPSSPKSPHECYCKIYGRFGLLGL